MLEVRAVGEQLDVVTTARDLSACGGGPQIGRGVLGRDGAAAAVRGPRVLDQHRRHPAAWAAVTSVSASPTIQLAREVEIQLGGGVEQQPGRRLAAVAGAR